MDRRRRAAVWAVGILVVVLIAWITEVRLDRGEPLLLQPPPGMAIVHP